MHKFNGYIELFIDVGARLKMTS